MKQQRCRLDQRPHQEQPPLRQQCSRLRPLAPIRPRLTLRLLQLTHHRFAAALNGGLGAVQPQGRFAVVLAFVANRTGTNQALPADFFVLKDAQGRVYTPNVDASNAYVQRGINADLGVQDAVPPDGLTRSIALVFDVQPDATNLVFFARSKPDQGWQVLTSVQ